MQEWKTLPEGGRELSLFKNFFSQTRKPEGFLGKIMLSTMNSGHAKMADWGMSHLPEMTPNILQTWVAEQAETRENC